MYKLYIKKRKQHKLKVSIITANFYFKYINIFVDRLIDR